MRILRSFCNLLSIFSLFKFIPIKTDRNRDHRVTANFTILSLITYKAEGGKCVYNNSGVKEITICLTQRFFFYRARRLNIAGSSTVAGTTLMMLYMLGTSTVAAMPPIMVSYMASSRVVAPFQL